LRDALLELHVVHLAVARTVSRSHLRQAVDAAHAHAVQAARDLVAVLVELAAGVQLGQRDLGRAALGLVLVVHLHAGRDAAAVVGDRDRVVGVDGDDDVVAVPASDSSMELSTTSNTRWCRPVPSEVSPMYMPGRLRTASSPSRIWMLPSP
jgi:hypothetical protein